ncbi:MAG: DUF3467 domain-containing protein [Terriglobia bacterium]
MADEQLSAAAQTPPLKVVRDEDFASLYANNIQFELSAWDFRLLFGELDQIDGAAIIRQHTAMTIPWSSVKLLIYFLQANLSIYEAANGFVRIPHDVIPPPPTNLYTPEQLENNPRARATVEFIAKIHEILMKSSTQGITSAG